MSNSKRDNLWEAQYEILKLYYSVYKHTNVPQSNKEIGRWVHTQRRLNKENRLDSNRKERLDELSFQQARQPYKSHIDTYERNVKKAEEYIRLHRTRFIPSIIVNDQQFANWCSNQRTFKSKGTLANDRIQALERIGFLWDAPCGRALETTVNYTNDDGTDFANMEKEEREETVIPPFVDIQLLCCDDSFGGGEFCTTSDDTSSSTVVNDNNKDDIYHQTKYTEPSNLNSILPPRNLSAINDNWLYHIPKFHSSTDPGKDPKLKEFETYGWDDPLFAKYGRLLQIPKCRKPYVHTPSENRLDPNGLAKINQQLGYKVVSIKEWLLAKDNTSCPKSFDATTIFYLRDKSRKNKLISKYWSLYKQYDYHVDASKKEERIACFKEACQCYMKQEEKLYNEYIELIENPFSGLSKEVEFMLDLSPPNSSEDDTFITFEEMRFCDGTLRKRTNFNNFCKMINMVCPILKDVIGPMLEKIFAKRKFILPRIGWTRYCETNFHLLIGILLSPIATDIQLYRTIMVLRKLN